MTKINTIIITPHRKHRSTSFNALAVNAKIGYIDIRAYKTELMIAGIYVSPDYRSQGVGAALLDTAIDFHNNATLKLVVHPYTEPKDGDIDPPIEIPKLIDFYQRHGFKQVSDSHVMTRDNKVCLKVS